MTDDNTTPKADDGFPKEALVFIPLIGSALAIAFDVGYFYGIDINFFTLFSVTEHLVFAMEALPIAFLFAVFITFTLGTEPGRKFLSMEGRSQKRRMVRWLIFPITFAFVAMGVFYGLVGVFSALITGFVSAVLYKTSPSRGTIFMCTGSLVLLMAWTTGFDVGRSYLRKGGTSHSIQIDNQVLAVKIIRSGDKGVLFYEPNEGQVAFLRWEAIKKISETWK